MRKKIIIGSSIFTSVLIISVLVMLIISLTTSRPVHSGQAPASITKRTDIILQERALTFAQYELDGKREVLLVTSHEDDIVTGVNLSEVTADYELDSIALFQKYGYEALLAMANNNEHITSVDISHLVVPAEFHGRNIGVGFNYKDHVDEVNLEEDPFFYPKLQTPVLFRSEIAVKSYTLPDYELELGIVLLEDVSKDDQAIEYLGFILAHDFSDRWPIVKNHIDKLFGKEPKPYGIRGYPVAKNRENSMPVGSFLVIPRDYKSYYRHLKLTLYRNNKLRQVADTSLLLWGIERMVSECFRNVDSQYETENGFATLLDDPAVIKARTVFLSGTPEGTTVRPTNWWNRALYLKPGEQVVLYGEGLGFIHNSIAK